MNEINCKTKIKSLTGLKAIAMLLIFWWHCPVPQPNVDLGARCCEFLFLVSGFLIGYNYMGKEIKPLISNSISYVGKKVSQFWLLYFITLVPLFVFRLIENGVSVKLFANLIINLLLLQSWNSLNDMFASINGAMWFMSALLFCYFIAFFLLYAIKSRSLGIKVIIFVVTFSFRLAIELIVKYYLPIISIHTFAPIRAMEFFLGMLTASFVLSIKNNITFTRKGSAIFSLLESIALFSMILACVLFNNLPRGFFVLCFSFLILLFSIDSGIVSKFLGLKIFSLFSKIQMEFFILHWPIIYILGKLRNVISIDMCLFVIIAFFITIFCSSFYVILLKEKFIKFSQFLFYKLFKQKR